MIDQNGLEEVRALLRQLGDASGTVFMLVAARREEPIQGSVDVKFAATHEGPWCDILHQVAEAYHRDICIPHGFDQDHNREGFDA